MSDQDPETIEAVELTAEQARAWQDTMSLMAWTAPGFRHLFYKLLTNNNGKHQAVFTRSIPYAATDGRNIMVNPDTFLAAPLQERVFVLAHEIMHNVYDDVGFAHRCQHTGRVPMSDGSSRDYVDSVMQRAMDYRINALLKDSRIGAPLSNPDYKICLDTAIAKAEDSVLDVYKKLYDDEDWDNLPKNFDIVLKPGQGPTRSPQQWAVEVKNAQTLESMKSQGNMAGALGRMFKDILEPEVPWTEHIQGIFNRRVGSGSYNWKRPDRRFICRDIHMPSRSGHGAGWVIIWGDTSGSIGDGDLQGYIGELAGIIDDVRPHRLTVLWCDTQVHGVSEITDPADLATIQREGIPGQGGGGTSIHPVFKWIEDNAGGEEPDMFVAFTDGYVTIPSVAPAYPCIWASTAKQPEDYPWGEVVMINQKKVVHH